MEARELILHVVAEPLRIEPSWGSSRVRFESSRVESSLGSNRFGLVGCFESSRVESSRFESSRAEPSRAIRDRFGSGDRGISIDRSITPNFRSPPAGPVVRPVAPSFLHNPASSRPSSWHPSHTRTRSFVDHQLPRVIVASHHPPPDRRVGQQSHATRDAGRTRLHDLHYITLHYSTVEYSRVQ